MRTRKRLASLQDKPKSFEVIGIGIGVTAFKDELIDLTSITNSDAERLIKKGFPYLKKKS